MLSKLLNRSHYVMFLFEFTLICARSRDWAHCNRPIGIAEVKRATTIIVFNEVEIKDLCRVRYSSTSYKGLLFCGFEHCWASRPSHLDRVCSSRLKTVQVNLPIFAPKSSFNSLSSFMLEKVSKSVSGTSKRGWHVNHDETSDVPRLFSW
jgi:hypothetical protein